MLKLIKKFICFFGLHSYKHIYTHTKWSDDKCDYVHIRRYECACNSFYESELVIKYNNIYPKLINKLKYVLIMCMLLTQAGCDNNNMPANLEELSYMSDKAYYTKYLSNRIIRIQGFSDNGYADFMVDRKTGNIYVLGRGADSYMLLEIHVRDDSVKAEAEAENLVE